MKLARKQNSVSQILQVFIQDSTSAAGAGLAGLAYNSAGLSAYYHRDTDAGATAITLITMSLGTFSSGGFIEIDAVNMPGFYQFCPVDTAFIGASSVVMLLKGATNMAPLPIEIDLAAQTDMVAINGFATDDNLATLKLKMLDIQNTDDHGVVIKSLGNDGHGIMIEGNGAGNGMTLLAGATGHGLQAKGGASVGNGLDTTAVGNGSGLFAGGSGVGSGLWVQGGDLGAGLLAVGGATGSGIDAEGGAIAGDGFISAPGEGTGGSGAHFIGDGAGHGQLYEGGISGDGLRTLGGSTSGQGIFSVAQGAGNGLYAIGGTDGDGIKAKGIGAGNGIQAVEGATGESFKFLIESGFSFVQQCRGFASALLSKLSGGATTINTFRDINNTKNRIIANVDVNGDRTNITLDLD